MMQTKKRNDDTIEKLLKLLNDSQELKEYVPLLRQVLNNVSISENDNFTLEDFFQECFLTLHSMIKTAQDKKRLKKELLSATETALKRMKQEQQFFAKLPDGIDPDQTKKLDDTITNLYIEQLKRNLPLSEGQLLDLLYVKEKSLKEAVTLLGLTIYKANCLKGNLLEHVQDYLNQDAVLLNESKINARTIHKVFSFV